LFRTFVHRRLPTRQGVLMAELATLVRVSRLYYELGETQERIAALVGVTRPQVSRLLKEAREQGVVEIRIVDRAEVSSPAAAGLEERFGRFGLRGVHLAPTLEGPAELTRRRVGRLAGQVLRSAIRDGMVVGVGDGASMSAMADELPAGGQVDVTVVPLCGGFWRSTVAAEPFRRVADALDAAAQPLHAPGLLDDPAVRDALLAHPGVRSATELWDRLDVAIFGIGGPSWTEASLGPQALRELGDGGAVGEVLIAPYDVDGRFVAESLRARTIAFDARELARLPLTIGVADGPGKLRPILGALRAGLVRELVTDVRTAEGALTLADQA
jgi:deoxyribonucleoside regulator